MNIPIEISIPEIWTKEKKFSKENWGRINYFMGPNGTGKSLFAKKLNEKLKEKGYRSRLLTAERLYGFENTAYDSFGIGTDHYKEGFEIQNLERLMGILIENNLSAEAFIKLKKRLDLRIIIQSILSQLFERELNIEEIGGKLSLSLAKPRSSKYDLRKYESNGLKEIISLLTFLYDESYDCLIIDEPELHLHPQFQMFIMNEIRKIIEDPKSNPNRSFFIFTHSPNFVDLRDIKDIDNCIIFHNNTIPTFISSDTMNSIDIGDIESLVPRLNTFLKQFLFATDPVFVEGYRDQQMFSLILNKLNIPFDATGHSILDVGGKAELAFFYKICNLLHINSKFIADLDIIFYKTKLLQSLSSVSETSIYLQEEGIYEPLMKYIGTFKSLIDDIYKTIKEGAVDKPSKESNNLIKIMDGIQNQTNSQETLDKRRFLFMMWFQNSSDKDKILKKEHIELLKGMFLKINNALERENIYLLKQGELEHYLRELDRVGYFPNEKTKSDIFDEARTLIIQSTTDKVQVKYSDLLEILQSCITYSSIDTRQSLTRKIRELIFDVIEHFDQDKITNSENFYFYWNAKWNEYEDLITTPSFIRSNDKKDFVCTFNVNLKVNLSNKVVYLPQKFTYDTNPSKFTLETSMVESCND